jgi:hypothetical protein
MIMEERFWKYILLRGESENKARGKIGGTMQVLDERITSQGYTNATTSFPPSG